MFNYGSGSYEMNVKENSGPNSWEENEEFNYVTFV